MGIALGLSIRSKLLGAALRHARLRAGLYPGEAAAVLGCDAARVEKYETGQSGISLPDLILWSEITGVPIGELLSGEPASPARDLPSADPRAVALCRKMLGVLMRQGRMVAGKSVDSAAQIAGVSADQLEALEAGTGDLPVPVLEVLASGYGVRLEDMAAEVASVSPSEAAPQAAEPTAVDQLPDDLRSLVTDRSYLKVLRLAEQISRMPAQVVRELGQSLLDVSME